MNSLKNLIIPEKIILTNRKEVKPPVSKTPIISVPFAFMCSSNIVPKWVSTLGTIIVAGIRTFPEFVYGLMLVKVTGPGAFAGVLTIGIVSIGMVTKLYIEAIEDLDKNIIESLDASGCTLLQKVRYGIIPQLSTNFVSTSIYRFEMNLKDATVLGLVGAGGIGAPLIFAMNSYKWQQVGAILIGLIVLVIIFEYGSTRIRGKLAFILHLICMDLFILLIIQIII